MNMSEHECEWRKYTYDNLTVGDEEPTFTLRTSCRKEYFPHIVELRRPEKCRCGRRIKFVGWTP